MSSSVNGFWSGKVAIVTGGSAGLGLELVRQLAAGGAKVGIVARDGERLQRVIAAQGDQAVRLAGHAADVCDEAAANIAVAALAERFGRLDLLINNVGVSSRLPVRDAMAADYLAAFKANFLSAVHCTLPALEHLARQRGSIVNVASLAARTAWPFMAPYSASKSALAAWSHQLRLELGSSIHVLLACPGPIQRSDAGNRYAAQADHLPAAAAQPGAGVRLRGLSPVWLAGKILRAVQARKLELVAPAWARIPFAIAQLSPRLADWILHRFGAIRSAPQPTLPAASLSNPAAAPTPRS